MIAFAVLGSDLNDSIFLRRTASVYQRSAVVPFTWLMANKSVSRTLRLGLGPSSFQLRVTSLTAPIDALSWPQTDPITIIDKSVWRITQQIFWYRSYIHGSTTPSTATRYQAPDSTMAAPWSQGTRRGEGGAVGKWANKTKGYRVFGSRSASY